MEQYMSSGFYIDKDKPNKYIRDVMLIRTLRLNLAY